MSEPRSPIDESEDDRINRGISENYRRYEYLPDTSFLQSKDALARQRTAVLQRRVASPWENTLLNEVDAAETKNNDVNQHFLYKEFSFFGGDAGDIEALVARLNSNRFPCMADLKNEVIVIRLLKGTSFMHPGSGKRKNME